MQHRLLARLLAACALTGCTVGIRWAQPGTTAQQGDKACLRGAFDAKTGSCAPKDWKEFPTCEASEAHKAENAKGWGYWHGRWEEDPGATREARVEAEGACCWVCREQQHFPGGRPLVAGGRARVAAVVPRAWEPA